MHGIYIGDSSRGQLLSCGRHDVPRLGKTLIIFKGVKMSSEFILGVVVGIPIILIIALTIFAWVKP